ncbi:MAG: hypothetical protein CEO22_652 [Candidatus Berkelbacteria bacterium Gr01-1014_85]|uniref:Uncharacterized protein n=1 Tax=Candidatus Berkelbacteria bacterium Gr01-1014_85 TaxID=2017150 RepID=A0A554J9B2_9BACT|nr:MAG: hypothetical protein CEO22_652 [Candidatus Berkelbacteria bacterium Gr01-1014_85]
MRVAGVMRCGLASKDCSPEVVRQNLLLQLGIVGLIITQEPDGALKSRITNDDDLDCDESMVPETQLIVAGVRIFTSEQVVNQTIPQQWYPAGRANELMAYRMRLARAWEYALRQRLSRVCPEGPTLKALQATYTQVERVLSGAERDAELDCAGLPPAHATAQVIVHWLTCRPDGTTIDHEIIWHDQHNASVAIVMYFPEKWKGPLFFSTFPVKIEVVS